MNDFLSFNLLITPSILIFFYYFFAVMIPVSIWILKDYLLKRFSLFENLFRQKQEQIYAVVFLLVLFLFLELMLRMMFEMIIAYFDIHNYLYKITQHI